MMNQEQLLMVTNLCSSHLHSVYVLTEKDSWTSFCCREVFKVVSLLLELGVAHNMVMLRGEPFDQNKTPGETTVVRTLLIPRKPALGNSYAADSCVAVSEDMFTVHPTGFKKLYECADAIPPFFAASCELALGFIPVLGRTAYTS